MYEEWLKRGSPHGAWLEPSADLSWNLKQIKLFATESRSVNYLATFVCSCLALETGITFCKYFFFTFREIFTDTLVQDGFLIPTQEQLESLDIDPTGEYCPWLMASALQQFSIMVKTDTSVCTETLTKTFLSIVFLFSINVCVRLCVSHQQDVMIHWDRVFHVCSCSSGFPCWRAWTG